MTTTFSATTYNVLAQCYVRPDRYRGSPADALDPATRRARLLARIDALGSDLLCLQEVEPDLYEALCARLDATHASAYAQRTGRREGSALFARRALFTWHGHDVLHFAAHRPGDDDLALIARLTVDTRPLHVATTHLTWQPDSTPTDEHLGHRQMLELLASRDAAPADVTWLVAGDFNATSQSVVLAAAYERGLAESCRAQRPWDTTAINGRPRKIDYLLSSEGRLDPRPGVLPRLSRDTVMPSASEPSDHLPLTVTFALVS
ncbi:endonuclease/exonuclease/phosphatase family protein [Polyangium mundeleinium]|uniref:Endonuclease/exonuclease/phosphatase family protein n=1 Tax=Polyangium mundeleinium TaxID=2995306 RepID=A0ABT5ETP2_9BACT|nr:endonuclease/exonuclease/phosphatase family protein [Polyangium mundeleinium]MDC0744719.1 endonuclease/exonuclease/phosphatase family protein [Polyangium mundeleinium]